MGLDTTHDCWHGSYTWFSRWRAALMRVAYDRDIMEMEHFNGVLPWSEFGDDKLVVLLDHSDCDGDIKAEDCAPLADRLEQLLPAMQHAGFGGDETKQFIKGLRLAVSKRQKVGFH